MKANGSIANSSLLIRLGLVLTLMTGPLWAEEHPTTQQQPAGPAQYAVVDLGTLGGSFGLAYAINDKGQIDGFSTISGDTAIHSFVFENGKMMDLGTLGGPNSESYAGLNNATQVPGSSDTSTSDPNGEDFCGFGTNLICLGFVWQNGVMTPLPTLGGNNNQAAGVNNRGDIAGYSETSKADPNCPPPQVLQFRPVVWSGNQIEVFPLYPGDAEGVVFWINNKGEVVGASGSCAAYDPRYGLPFSPQHALLWRKGRRPIDLGNLGGRVNNAAFAINDKEQVVGTSDLLGDQYQHAFLWQKGVMTDLGTLPGDAVSAALAVNNRGQVTGVSIDPSGQYLRAFLWQNGVMIDLNSLIPPNSPLYLLHGFGINSAGEIVGFAFNSNTGNVDAFLAIPTNFGGGTGASTPAGGGSGVAPKVVLSEQARKQLQQWLRVRRFAPPAVDPQSPPSR